MRKAAVQRAAPDIRQGGDSIVIFGLKFSKGILLLERCYLSNRHIHSSPMDDNSCA